MAYAAVEGYERMLTGMRRYRDAQAKARTRDSSSWRSPSTWAGPATTPATARSRCTTPCITTAGRAPIRRATPPIRGCTACSRRSSSTLMKLEGGDFAAEGAAGAGARRSVHRDPRAPRRGRHVTPKRSISSRRAARSPTPPNAEARALVHPAGGARRGAAARPRPYRVGQQRPAAGERSGRQSDHARRIRATTRRPAARRRIVTRGRHRPQAGGSTVASAHVGRTRSIGKNFYLFEAHHATSSRDEGDCSQTPALTALRDARLARLATAAASCTTEPRCHADAFRME